MAAAIFKLRGRDVALLLDEDGIYIEPYTQASPGCCCGLRRKHNLEHVPWEEVISARLAPCRSGCLGRKGTRHQVLLVSVLSRHSSRPWQWSVRQLELHAQQQGVAAHWLQLLQQQLQKFPHRPRRLLVLVNPFGGKRQARDIWERVAAPLMHDAGVTCDVVETSHQGHAESIVCSLSSAQLAALDGVVAVGGDGLFAELLTGVLQHNSLEEALQLRLAHIPAGSTDAVACTLHGTRDALTATLHVILGDQTALDVGQLVPLPAAAGPAASAGAGAVSQGGRDDAEACRLEPQEQSQQQQQMAQQQQQMAQQQQQMAQPQQQLQQVAESLVRHFVCVASYGFLGDVLAASDQLRWLGPARYDIAGALSFLKLRSYEAEVWYKPADTVAVDSDSIHVPATAQRAAHTQHIRHGLPAAGCSSNCSHHVYQQLGHHDRQGQTPAAAGALLTAGAGGGAGGGTPAGVSRGTTGGSDANTVLGDSKSTAHAVPRAHTPPAAAVAAVHVSAGSVSSVSSTTTAPQHCRSGCEVCSAAATMRHSSSREQMFAADSRALRAEAGEAGAGNSGSGWCKVQGKFSSIMCLVTSCRSDKSRRGMVPGAHLADGVLVLVLVRKASRLAFLRFLLQLTTRGVLPETPGVQIECVTAVQVHPTGRQGCWNIDGELLKHGRVSMGVHGGLVDVFARGVEAAH